MKNKITKTLAALGVVATLAVPASALADQKVGAGEQQLLTALHEKGIGTPRPADTIKSARGVCSHLRAGQSIDSVVAAAVAASKNSTSTDVARFFVFSTIKALCPQAPMASHPPRGWLKVGYDKIGVLV